MSENSNSRIIKALKFQHTLHTACLKTLDYDLSARQMSVLLSVYLAPASHSVKNLSDSLGISKPAICRALDVLERAKLIKRQRDKEDKRSVIIQRTVKGSVFLSEYADIVLESSKVAA